MRKFAVIFAIVLLVAEPAFALPGPLLIAEAGIPKKIPANQTAQEYVDQLATFQLYEAESARLALQKTKSAEVREFASMILKNRGAAASRLKALIAASTIRTTLPQKLGNAHLMLLEQLRRSAGAEFDTRYIQQQVDGYERLLERHRDYARRGEDMVFKHMAGEEETGTAVRLDLALKISHSLGGLQPRA